jgi:hippurate hydrolase
MIEDGLFSLFPCDAIFAMHNMPGVEVGNFLFRNGAIMAAVDDAEITVRGKGGHGAMPHLAHDPIVAASAIVMALQTIVARNIEPGEEAVITVGSFVAGTAATIIPEVARLKVGVRTCSDQARDLLERRVKELARLQAASLGCTADVIYERSYPCLINSTQEHDFARSVALAMGGEEGVRDLARPFMLSEDFAYMLRELPGCYFFMGNGPTASLHDCHYDFNDEAILPGVRYWAALAERYLAA